jgi:hypothetical protein
VSEGIAPAAAGWYPLPEAAPGGSQVGYWDGAAWTGAQRRAGGDGSKPRDLPGRVALGLLCAGFVATIAFPFVDDLIVNWWTVPSIALTVAILVVLAATPIALITSIAGLVRGHQLKFQTPLSLASLILSFLGTVVLALPIALFVTGVWVLPHI